MIEYRNPTLHPKLLYTTEDDSVWEIHLGVVVTGLWVLRYGDYIQV